MLELGGWVVHVPYPATWLHEVEQPPPAGAPRYTVIEHLGLLPELLGQLEHG